MLTILSVTSDCFRQHGVNLQEPSMCDYMLSGIYMYVHVQ